MHQEHKNTVTQNKLKQLKLRFGRLLRPPAANGVGLLSKKKVSKEVSK